MKLSIALECQSGLTWPRWKEFAAAAERLGFYGIYLSDHFPDSGSDSVEAITALTHLAGHSQTIRFGTLVSPLSVRDPVMLARQALMINDLGGDRMVLGIGAGWMESEHTAFGYALGDMAARMARLEEGAQVITKLMHSETPVTVEGRIFQLHQARLKSSWQQPASLLIGGNGPKFTLPIVAKYADIWNCLASPVEVFRQRSAQLDALLQQSGRKSTDVRRTLYVPVSCWCDAAGMEQIAQSLRKFPFLAELSTTEIFDWWRSNVAAITGSPESVVEQLRVYEDAGVEEMMIAIMGADRLDYLEMLASLVLPYFGEKSDLRK